MHSGFSVPSTELATQLCRPSASVNQVQHIPEDYRRAAGMSAPGSYSAAPLVEGYTPGINPRLTSHVLDFPARRRLYGKNREL